MVRKQTTSRRREPISARPTRAVAARRRRDAAATRADLLEAARIRLAVHGYERTTLRDVAADVGVNVALINRYFGSKDGLAEAVLRDTDHKLLKVPYGEPGTDLLAQLLRGLGRTSWPQYGGQNPLVALVRDTTDDPRMTKLRQRGIQGFARSIAAAAPPSADDLSDADRELAAQLVAALYIGTSILRTVVPIRPLAGASVDRLRHPLERAIAALFAPGPDEATEG